MAMISAPPNGRVQRDTAADPATVLKAGYLPQHLRDHLAVDPEYHVYLNRFPRGDIDNFSVCRHAYALGRKQLGSQSAMMRYAPWETQYFLAADEVSMKAQGDAVSIQDGGALAPEWWSSQWSDLLRAFSPIEQLPVTRLSVPYRILHFPKVATDVTVSEVKENTTITATAFQFGQVSYTARKDGITIPVSNELMRDAPFLADQVLRRSSAGALALDRDTQILTGQGGPNVTGLITLATGGTISKYYPPATVTGNLQTTANHATPSFFHLSQLRGKIHQLNASTNAPATGQAHCNGMIVHSRFEQTVLTQGGSNGPWTDANGRPLWMSGLSNPATRASEDHAADGALLGQIWVMTNILPTNSTDGGGSASSFIIAGWWEQFAVFAASQIAYAVTTEESYFQLDQTGVRVTHRWDAGPIHPEAFAVLAGADQ
jgi:HK97 family phage major capsid protein